MSEESFMSEIESLELEDVDATPNPTRTDPHTRQKSSAAVQTIDLAAVLAEISGPMTQARHPKLLCGT